MHISEHLALLAEHFALLEHEPCNNFLSLLNFSQCGQDRVILPFLPFIRTAQVIEQVSLSVSD